MIINKEFGERVRILMKARGLNGKQLADAIDENATSVTSYLNGNRKPKVEFLTKLIEFFPEADLNWLFRNDTSGFNQAQEPGERYEIPKNPTVIVENIEQNLKELKALLSQK